MKNLLSLAILLMPLWCFAQGVTPVASSVVHPFLSLFGSFGTQNGQFSNPYGIKIASNGNLIVADYNNNRIQEFNSLGIFQLKWGIKGNGRGQLRDPYGVTVDGKRNVYV